MLRRLALLAIAAPRRLLGIAALVFVAAAILGAPVAKSLAAGGMRDPTSQSAEAARLLAAKFGESDQQLLVAVTAPEGVDSEQARKTAIEIVGVLRQSNFTYNVASPWTSPRPIAASLVSTDHKSGLIVANLKGGEEKAPTYAQQLSDELVGDHPGVQVRAGGIPMLYAQVNSQSQHDLVVMEAIAIPLSFLALVWVFGGLLAAALPVAVGLLAIVGSMAILRLISLATDVSTFAMNLTTAMGLALAIDYTLLIISRYRDELADGLTREQALIRAVATAGRTVLFSATIVALSMAVMVAFPMYFLTSFAYAGVATVVFAGLAAIVVTPAAMMLLGPRLDSLDVRRGVRRLFGRPEPTVRPLDQMFWYRAARLVMRRAIPIGLAVTALLVFLGLPFLQVRWGFADDRFLPRAASAHQVGDQLRQDFGTNLTTAVPIIIPKADGLTSAELDRYAAELSWVRDVAAVSAPDGTFTNGTRIGPPSAAAGRTDDSAFLTVISAAPLYSKAASIQLDRLHQVPGPAGRQVLMSGLTQTNRDTIGGITSRLPMVLGLIAVITFALLFALTGSVVLPIKALILNVLSLTATFGALVWIFQDGHLGALGTTPTGTLIVNMPVLLFCIAFGLSMDYEVFLLSRIHEYWLTSSRTGQANNESVALGLAHTGRVITAAALVMSISFAALAASQVSFMRMFGLGLTLAIVMDATLVRTVLVPAFMHVMGRANWWAPRPLVWLHKRIAISESDNRHSDSTTRIGPPLRGG